MAQTTILAAAQTAGTSTDITLAENNTCTVGIFATGEVPPLARFSVREDTPGTDNFVIHLHAQNMSTVLAGPGVFRVYRPDISAYGVDVGVYKTED